MKSLLPRLYALFLHCLREHPETAAWKGENLNSSEFFYKETKELAADLISGCDKETFIATVGKAVAECQFPADVHIFTGAVYAIAAAKMLELGDAKFAQKLAERAISYSQFDLFAQSIILKANHALDPSTRSYEDTEAWLKTRFCMYPFTMVETTTTGEFYRCCPSYLPVPVGDMDAPDLKAVFHSKASQAVRESIVDGSFKYCSKLYCPVIGGRELMSREEGMAKLAELDEFPEQVIMSHDRSCNLSCPSCREERIVIPKVEQERLDALSERLLTPLMEHAKYVSITGSGDPFASIHFRNLLINYCKKAPKGSQKLSLQTNGVLFDQRAWESIGLSGHVKEVLISIDAAQEDTYDIVRRDGNFKRLHENMKFISSLRHSGQFGFLILRFVVQGMNFREMAAFVRQGKEWGVDRIQFTQMRNWGTFSPEAFAQQAVTARENPDHQEFLEMLKDPIFEDPIVWLGDIDNFRAKAA